MIIMHLSRPSKHPPGKSECLLFVGMPEKRRKKNLSLIIVLHQSLIQSGTSVFKEVYSHQ